LALRQNHNEAGRFAMRFDECGCTRRDLAGLAILAFTALPARAGDQQRFITEAFRQRDIAVKAGDQAYGAIVVRVGEIIGYGPSRVVQDRNDDAHAERVAIADAQRQSGATSLAGAILYSSSRPCRICERAAAAAGIERMIHGLSATDAGAPRA
jgi:tRNA(Arg) A34 adenosine deaminase TadA